MYIYNPECIEGRIADIQKDLQNAVSKCGVLKNILESDPKLYSESGAGCVADAVEAINDARIALADCEELYPNDDD